MSTLITLLVILLVLVLLVGPWLVATANRLDRLHVRTDAAWAALDATLARRAVLSRAIAAAGCLGPDRADRLRAVAERAEHTPRGDREEQENELSGLLSEVDRARLPLVLAADLVDAEQRVVIARRVHNDAVRDTLVQRRRRVVRWLKLAGTAPRPEYFEIVEPALGEDGGVPLPRPSARLLLVDGDDRVLLFNGHDPARPGDSFWFTVGGGVEPGEDLRTAAVREGEEETGIRLAETDLVGPVWRRRVQFSFDGRNYDGEEWFFLARLSPEDGVAAEVFVDTSRFTDLEARTVDNYRWWSAAELSDTDETVFPAQLGELLPELLASTWDGRLRAVR
ncbi:hypothetical protein EV193_109165 [Herbihabitans rhizosphaerae]|uniref:Nudix hydrolase domain-containing protein n=1 Tax=Herbihabitans rhizosphaerae TaxID=1872711 RepID=A0A4Q7KHK7_9PSEU|nr:NUDIX domain-containing protein [Herbihabitans rhizosphaerae]RZS34378.1 hypothetical protein EV193_109165 [Herbihabitans rhizosphaerae]